MPLLLEDELALNANFAPLRAAAAHLAQAWRQHESLLPPGAAARAAARAAALREHASGAPAAPAPSDALDAPAAASPPPSPPSESFLGGGGGGEGAGPSGLMPRFGGGAVPATDGMVMLPAAELYLLAMRLQHEGDAAHAEARRIASELCLRHLPTHDGRERAPLQGALRGSVAPPPPELVTQLETRAAFELLESAPGLVRQYTLRRALLAPSLSHRPLAAHQARPRQAHPHPPTPAPTPTPTASPCTRLAPCCTTWAWTSAALSRSSASTSASPCYPRCPTPRHPPAAGAAAWASSAGARGSASSTRSSRAPRRHPTSLGTSPEPDLVPTRRPRTLGTTCVTGASRAMYSKRGHLCGACRTPRARPVARPPHRTGHEVTSSHRTWISLRFSQAIKRGHLVSGR